MKRLLVLVVVLAVSAVWPALSGAATFKGVVVAKEHGTLLVARSNGVVASVSGRASVGARVAVSGRSVRVVGRASRALVRGIVVKRTATTMFLSAGRHLLAVQTGRHTASVSDSPPTGSTPLPGSVVSTQVTINGDQLDEDSTDDLGQTGATTVQATVSAVAAGSVTLTINGQLLTVPLPAGLTLPATLVGQQVSLQLSFAGGQTQVSGDNQGDDNDQGDNGNNGGGQDDSGGGDG
jgi:hypothetical protein